MVTKRLSDNGDRQSLNGHGSDNAGLGDRERARERERLSQVASNEPEDSQGNH